MIGNVPFVHKYYADQIDALKGFINDAFPYLPNRDNSFVRFGGGTALAMYYFQHRLSYDIDLFVTDPQIMSYLSPKHWFEETNEFNTDKYIDLNNHIRVLYRKNNIKVDVLIAQDFIGEPLIDSTKDIFSCDLYVESIEDIIAKKIVYRRKENLTRDIIDIAISIKYGDNVIKKLYDKESIILSDVNELYESLLSLDTKMFNEELEIVKPFDKYLSTAQQAPYIIKKECLSIIDRK